MSEDNVLHQLCSFCFDASVVNQIYYQQSETESVVEDEDERIKNRKLKQSNTSNLLNININSRDLII